MVRMRCNGPEKAETLEAVKSLQAQGCATLPTMQEALWYDDKIAQYDALKKMDAADVDFHESSGCGCRR